MQRKIRVLVGKPGLDGHDRGAKVVAAALRDAGMEVIYTGLHQTPEQVVEAAIQEDVDVVALSILSGAHMALFPEVLELMRSCGVGDKLLTGGGIIPAEDMETLGKQGVGRLFGPGASTRDIVDYVRSWFASKQGAGALAPLPESFGRNVPAGFESFSQADHRAAHRLAPKPQAKATGSKPGSAPRRRAAVAKPARAAARSKPKAARRAGSGTGVKRTRKPAAQRGKTSARRGAGARR